MAANHYFFIKIGSESQESFQLLQDCDWDLVIHPNRWVDGPNIPHHVMLSPNDGGSMNCVWTIGQADFANAGEVFKVNVRAVNNRVLNVKWERADYGSKELQTAVSKGQVLQRE